MKKMQETVQYNVNKRSKTLKGLTEFTQLLQELGCKLSTRQYDVIFMLWVVKIFLNHDTCRSDKNTTAFLGKSLRCVV